MTIRETVIAAVSNTDSDHIVRCLAIANHLLHQERHRHPGLTPHDVVITAYREILEGRHDADYRPDLIAFFYVVMARIIAARKKAVRGAGVT